MLEVAGGESVGAADAAQRALEPLAQPANSGQDQYLSKQTFCTSTFRASEDALVLKYKSGIVDTLLL